MKSDCVLRVEDLSVQFDGPDQFWPSRNPSVHALQNVSLEIKAGETLGLVGESGCGKSTLGRCIVQVLKASSGKIFFRDQEITGLKSTDLRPLRRKIQMVFQDSLGCLNPRMTISEIMEEPLRIHEPSWTRKDRQDRVQQLTELVGLHPDQLHRYPHEFSGGQRQRIGIARALSMQPELLICDEPVSALDVSIQAQILNLLMDLQDKLALSYLFITHDLRVVESVSDRVAVMYLGKIVEIASISEIFYSAKHPFTRALLSSVPQLKTQKREPRIVLKGDLPSPLHPPSGCPFHPRCPNAQDLCRQQAPTATMVSQSHTYHCFFP